MGGVGHDLLFQRLEAVLDAAVLADQVIDTLLQDRKWQKGQGNGKRPVILGTQTAPSIVKGSGIRE
jgi:hypothetical protein